MSLVAALSPIPAVCRTCEQQTVLVRVANDSAGRAANSTSPLIPSSSWQATSSHKGASAKNPPVNARTTSAHVHPAAAGVNGARAANLVRPVGPDRMSLRRTPKCHEDTSTKKSPLCDKKIKSSGPKKERRLRDDFPDKSDIAETSTPSILSIFVVMNSDEQVSCL